MLEVGVCFVVDSLDPARWAHRSSGDALVLPPGSSREVVLTPVWRIVFFPLLLQNLHIVEPTFGLAAPAGTVSAASFRGPRQRRG